MQFGFRAARWHTVIALLTLLAAYALPTTAAEKRAALPVSAVTAVPATIRNWIYGQGTARSVRREYLMFEAAGKVEWIKSNTDGTELKEGDLVAGPANNARYGELLARQDTREVEAELATAESAIREAEQQLSATQADLAKTEAQSRTAATDLKRKAELQQRRAISQSEYDAAVAKADEAKAGVAAAQARIEAAQASVIASRARAAQVQVSFEKLHLYAPIDGVVANINISRGQYWSPNFLNTSSEEAALNSVPILIIDPTRFEVTLDLPAFDGARVQRGQKAFLVVPSVLKQDGAADTRCETCGIDQTGIPAEVYSVSPAVNPGGRSIQVKLRTTGKAIRGISDGLYVSAWLVTEEKDEALVLPRNALLFRGNAVSAFVVDANGLAEQRALKLGILSTDGVEVLAGIKRGERVVTRGRNRLTTGTPVQVVEATK